MEPTRGKSRNPLAFHHGKVKSLRGLHECQGYMVKALGRHGKGE